MIVLRTGTGGKGEMSRGVDLYSSLEPRRTRPTNSIEIG